MRISRSYVVNFLIFVFGFQANATLLGAGYGPIPVTPLIGHNNVRSLKAATTKSGIKARAIQGCLEREIDLHYLDGSPVSIL